MKFDNFQDNLSLATIEDKHIKKFNNHIQEKLKEALEENEIV